MGPMDSEASLKLQSELVPGENLLWADRPNPSVTFHASDRQVIPFSLLWGGFSILWEARALGFLGHASKGTPPIFMALWGIPFVLLGQYLIWGRFVYDGWLKRRTYYGITNQRLIVLQEGTNPKRCSIGLNAISSIGWSGSFIGTLRFGTRQPIVAGRGQKNQNASPFTVGNVPVFVDIDDVQSVCRLVQDLAEKAKSAQSKAAAASNS